MYRWIGSMLIALGVVIGATACATKDEAEFPIPITDAGVSIGREVYSAHCVSCHGLPGEVPPLPVAPRHDELGHTWHHTDRHLYEWILDGTPLATVMPAFRGSLTEQQVRDVIAYIKSSWPASVRASQESLTRQYEKQLSESAP